MSTKRCCFAEKADADGIWRMDQGKLQRVAEGSAPELRDFFAVAGDQLYYANKTDPNRPAISAVSIYGGGKERLIDLPFGQTGFTLGVNPKSGDIIFSMSAAEDTDIALIRLARR